MNEFWRKTFHLVFGLLISLFIWMVPKEQSVIVLGIGLLGGLWIIDLAMRDVQLPGISHLLYHLERPGVIPGKGAFYFVFSSLICLILFPSSIAAEGVLVLAILDGMATIFGLRYGKIRIINHKSIEGTGGAILITFLVLLCIMSPAMAAMIAVVAGLVELVSPIDDNLVIPLVVSSLIFFIP